MVAVTSSVFLELQFITFQLRAGFGGGFLGLLKAIVWPLFVVLEVLKFVGA